MHLINSLLIAATIACMAYSCRSVGKEIQIQNASLKQTAQYGSALADEERLTNDTLHRLSALDEYESVTVHVAATKYDTSHLDAALDGKYPVAEQTVMTIKKNKSTAQRTNENSSSQQQITGRKLEYSETENLLASKEQNSQRPGKDPYRWRYAAMAAITIAFLFWLWYKCGANNASYHR